MPEVIAPEARLRLKVELFRQIVVHVLFFAVHEGRHPHTRLHIRAPAVKVEPPAGMSVAAVCAVEPHNIEILVFHPDAAKKTALAALLLWRDVKHQAAHFAEEFAAHIVKLVVLFVESVGVEKNHLQEAIRHKLQRKREEIADGTEDLLPLGIGVREGNERYTRGEVRRAEEIRVAGRGIAEDLSG